MAISTSSGKPTSNIAVLFCLAVVLAVGAGRRGDNGDLIPMDVSVGDTVVYSKYGGTEIASNGEDLLILNARDVLAIVK